VGVGLCMCVCACVCVYVCVFPLNLQRRTKFPKLRNRILALARRANVEQGRERERKMRRQCACRGESKSKSKREGWMRAREKVLGGKKRETEVRYWRSARNLRELCECERQRQFVCFRFGSGIFCVASYIRMQFVVLIKLVVLIDFVTCLASAIMIYLTYVCNSWY